MEKLLDLSVEQYRGIFVLAITIIILGVQSLLTKYKRLQRQQKRRDYYRNVYLKSDAWRRKRFVVLSRDNWLCVYCGAKASQVHHKRYARNHW
jgi:hypothetical protein